MKVKELIKDYLKQINCKAECDIENWLSDRYETLDDLTKRLQDNYYDGEPFEQLEEDRLTTYDLCDFLGYLNGIIRKEDFIKRLEMLCFDTLGDHIDPKKIRIRESNTGKILVCFKEENLYSPLNFVFEDWKRDTQGTEFEKVELVVS